MNIVVQSFILVNTNFKPIMNYEGCVEYKLLLIMFSISKTGRIVIEQRNQNNTNKNFKVALH